MTDPDALDKIVILLVGAVSGGIVARRAVQDYRRTDNQDDGWQRLTDGMRAEIADLRTRVTTLEASERDCKEELYVLRARMDRGEG